MSKRLPFGLVWFPGMRAKAYLNVLKELDVYPSVIICMKNSRSEIDGLSQEAVENGYNEDYFDVDYGLDDYLPQYDCSVIYTDATDINDQIIAHVLRQQTEKNWIFTGGGILKEHLFNDGMKFLHVHPGKLPDYRGSTCFYFSLLKDMTLSASAFYLSAKLDDGEVLLTTNFKVNILISEKNKLFIDHVLDPWIRSISLKQVLVKVLNKQPIKTVSYSESNARAYYVMHPVLRSMVVDCINRHYVSAEDKGVFVIK